MLSEPLIDGQSPMLVIHGPPGLDYATILTSAPPEIVRSQCFLIAEHDDADHIWIERASGPDPTPATDR